MIGSLLTWLRAEWDRALGVALIVAGAVALFVGYQGAADAAFVVEALAYIASGGLGGVVLIGGGLTLMLSADLHDEWRKLDAIEAAIRDAGLRPNVDVRTVTDTASATPAGGNGNGGDADPDLRGASRRWRRRSVGAFGALALLCGGALTLAWDGTASAAEPGDAFESVSRASGAVALYGVCAGALLLVQRQRGRIRRQRILAPFARLAAAGAPLGSTSAAAPSDDRPLVLAGSARYHRPGCAALAGTAATPAADADLARLRPCGLCHTA
jgi:hypothetical protein